MSFPGTASADDVTIPSGDNWFCDPSFRFGSCPTTISVGDSVTWTYPEGFAAHTTTECGASCDSPTGTPVWDSGFMLAGDTFTWTFETPAVFVFYCTFHPNDMRGTIVVQAPTPTPTPTPSPTSAPTDETGPTPTPTPTAVESAQTGADQASDTATAAAASLPTMGGPPPQGGGVGLWTVVLAAGAALAMAGAAILSLMRRKAG